MFYPRSPLPALPARRRPTRKASVPVPTAPAPQKKAHSDVAPERLYLPDIERELAHREAAAQRLMPFITYLYPYYFPSVMNQLIAAALEELEARRIRNLLILAPPQHGKSSEVSQFFPPWYLGRNPDHDIILCSYNASLAEQHSWKARQIFHEDRYAAVFPDVKLADRSKSLKHWRLEGHRGSMKTAGVGGGVTGFGARLLLVDDPLRGWKDANSEIIRQQQINWWDSEADTRVSPYDGARCLTFTHWHEADIGGTLLKRQATGGALWHVLRLTALAETREQIREWCDRHNVTPDRYLVGAASDTQLRALYQKYRRRPDQIGAKAGSGPMQRGPYGLARRVSAHNLAEVDEMALSGELDPENDPQEPFEGAEMEIGGPDW